VKLETGDWRLGTGDWRLEPRADRAVLSGADRVIRRGGLYRGGQREQGLNFLKQLNYRVRNLMVQKIKPNF
jgi:hypothetical protein